MNDETLFINEKMINRFLTLKKFNRYTSSDMDILLLSIFNKIIDDDFVPEDKLIENEHLTNAYISFYDDISYKRKLYYNQQIENIKKFYDRKKNSDIKVNYSLDDTISRIKYKTSYKIKKTLCHWICKNIIKTKSNSDFSQLFVLMCRYVFDEHFFNDIQLLESKTNYIYNSFANVQFIHMKELIDANNKKYYEKVEINKAKKNEKVSK